MIAAQGKTGLLTGGLLVLVAVVMMAHTETQALPTLSGSFACAKDYLINLVRDKIISKSALVAEYQNAMKIVQERFDAAEAAGELEAKDDKEKENFYLKLVVEEMRNMKERIDANHNAGKLDLGDKVNACVGKTDEYDPDAEVQNWSPDEALEDDKDIEQALMTELDELERQASGEDEMGWSMSPEVKESLKVRTRVVLTDLMNNEARQIAMALLTAYMTGGTSMSTVLMPLLGGLKFKLAEFLINAMTDVASSLLGRKIRVGDVDSSPSATVAPAAAA